MNGIFWIAYEDDELYGIMSISLSLVVSCSMGWYWFLMILNYDRLMCDPLMVQFFTCFVHFDYILEGIIWGNWSIVMRLCLLLWCEGDACGLKDRMRILHRTLMSFYWKVYSLLMLMTVDVRMWRVSIM